MVIDVRCFQNNQFSHVSKRSAYKYHVFQLFSTHLCTLTIKLCLVQNIAIVEFLLQMFSVTVAENFVVQDAINIYQHIYMQLILTSAMLVSIKIKQRRPILPLSYHSRSNMAWN